MNDRSSGGTSSALPAGTRLGELEILRVIGVGGFSVVYLARDHALDREVAIKEYLPALLAGRSEGPMVSPRSASAAATFDVGLRSFVNEGRLLARFDHPSLLKVFRFWEQNGTAYMMMPVLRGKTLKEHRGLVASPDEAWLRALLDRLMGAIEMLHREGVFHRDIAPDNIFVDAGGNPILLDFGAARRIIGDRTEMTIILKPAYAPIEQYADRESLPQGPWTDLYALGATMHYLLTGRPPTASTSRAVGDAQEPLAMQTLAGVSKDFLAIVDWMLELRPADRPQSVSALRARLEAVGSRTADAGTGAPVARRAAAAVSGFLRRIRDAMADDRPAPTPTPTPTTGDPRSPAGDDLTVLVSGPRAADAATPPTPALHPPVGDATVLFDRNARPGADPFTSSAAGSATQGGKGAPAVALIVTASDLGSYIGRKVVVDRDELTIGRDPGGFHLPDPQWSRRHVMISRTAEGISISDLDSSNGTYVNGVRLAVGRSYPLQLGALIQIGSTTFALSLAEDAGPLDLTGTELADAYDLIDCLQASPKGVLYRGRNKRSGREVAIKVLSPDYASFSDYRRLFARQATIAARLQHPHICSLEDFGETAVVRADRRWRVPFVAYEMMAGGNLAERLQDARTITTETIAQWLLHLAEALEHAHENGVVHGNLKPSAICFDRASNIYVTDFAIAGPEDVGQALMGTPAYMAPEQWEGVGPQPASDQYALAVLAYLLLGGVRPYEGQVTPEARAINLKQPPESLHRRALIGQQRKFSPLASRVVERALAASPADRHATIGDFGRELALALRSSASLGAGAQVFVSYRRETSSGWVAYLADQLEREHGITSFIDTLGLDGAVKFPARIQRAIENCAVFVCVLAPGTLQSPYVRQEIALAFREGKRMIPVMQEGFVASEAELADPATQELLVYDGVKLLDRQNIYVRAAVAELAQQIRVTLGDLARAAPAALHQKH